MIKPGKTIGIIGGGQLGRMLSMAAAARGYRVHIYTPDEGSPASQVSANTTVAAYDDAATLSAFAQDCDVITFEFENIPAESLALLAKQCPVHPKPSILHTTSHRLREKEAINALGIATASFRPVTDLASLQAAVAALGVPSVLKTCEMGYDGKGQVKLTALFDTEEAWQSLNTSDAILEGFVSFAYEASIIVARNEAGDMRCYDPAHNIHEDHILARSLVPSGMSGPMIAEAEHIARKIAESLELVGILAIELFVMQDGRLLVNELAPRPHNSGHWTIEAAATSQFEQQIRAITGAALGDTRCLSAVEMHNIIGDAAGALIAEALADPQAHLHLYGKAQAKPGRKMGHITSLMD